MPTMRRLIFSTRHVVYGGLLLCMAIVLHAMATIVTQAEKAQASARATSQAPAYFEDVAEKAHLVDNIVFGEDRVKKYILETTGTGVAIFDYDNDGWPDIFIVNGTKLADIQEGAKPTNHLYHNNRDGTFTDVTEKAGLKSAGWGQGVCVGDYDNDGFEDLYVTYYGKNRLYHNEGNGTFKDVSERAGVAGTGAEWGTGCAFIDYDRDGLLDLIVANYVDFKVSTAPLPGQNASCLWKGAPVMCGPRGLKPSTNVLYHNLGNGRFTNVTLSSGISRTPGHYCFSVSTLDYDSDGWPDIYVACDSAPSILYHNNRNGTFTDTAVVSGVAFNEDGREQAGMGSTIADYDGDGRPDIFKTNFSDDTSTLYHNNGDGTFSDVTFAAGLGINTQYLGWGTMFFDFDNDSWPDLLLVNGHVYPEVEAYKLGSSYQEPRVLYHNTGKGSFQDVSKFAGPGITAAASGRGLAIGDLWNNGSLAAVVANMGSRPSLLVNRRSYANHWLGIKTVGSQSNRDGIGTQVTVKFGLRILKDEVRSGSSYDSNNDMRLHFGLGPATKVDLLEVRWPSGLIEQFDNIKIDRIIVLREGSGRSTAAKGVTTRYSQPRK
jgi:enediyne biosynthesis protein E4